MFGKALVLLAVVLSGRLVADPLPMLSENPWSGWYVGWKSRDFRFGIKSNGVAVLIPIRESRTDDTPRHYWVEFRPMVEEMRDGKLVELRSLDDRWEAVSPGGVGPKGEVTCRGTTSGDVRFEMNFGLDGKTIRGGGRIVDKGRREKAPLRLSIRVRFPEIYRYDDAPEETRDKAEDDRIEFRRADGKKLRFDSLEEVNGAEQSGPGILEARIELEPYQERRFELKAGPAARFELSNKEKGPLYKGFVLNWKVDSGKDPQGKARFEVEFK